MVVVVGVLFLFYKSAAGTVMFTCTCMNMRCTCTCTLELC